MTRIYRHRLPMRLWHWINAVTVIVMFMSGLMIFNAHPRLYWGHYGANNDAAWLVLDRFPGWMTIPSGYSLSDGRLWHFAFAWVLAFGLAFNLVMMLVNGHFRRDIALSAKEVAPKAVVAALRSSFARDAHGDGRYNVLQKLFYSFVLFFLLPGMILTGLAMAPGINAAWPWLVDILGGRQSARSLHFIMAWGLFLFLFAVHMPALLLAGPVNHVRSMITGWYRVKGDTP
jgi:thiosulfate reductase cytochrome b subunit